MLYAFIRRSERFKRKQLTWSIFCVGDVGDVGMGGFVCVYVCLSLCAFVC